MVGPSTALPAGNVKHGQSEVNSIASPGRPKKESMNQRRTVKRRFKNTPEVYYSSLPSLTAVRPDNFWNYVTEQQAKGIVH